MKTKTTVRELTNFMLRKSLILKEIQVTKMEIMDNQPPFEPYTHFVPTHDAKEIREGFEEFGEKVLSENTLTATIIDAYVNGEDNGYDPNTLILILDVENQNAFTMQLDDFGNGLEIEVDENEIINSINNKSNDSKG